MNRHSYSQEAGALVVCVGLALIVGIGDCVAEQSPENIRVFITHGDGSTDFVDPDAKASAEDIKKAFRGRKDIAVVESEGSSDLVVRVLRRFRGPSGRSVAIATSPTTAIAAPVLERVVVATIRIGDFALELNGAHTRSWSAASDKLVDQIEKWIRENRARILERRHQQGAV
jgi:hypothetical protein